MFKKIKKLRSTERGKVLFKFMLYMIFFAFVVVLAIATGAAKSPYMNYSGESNEEESMVESRPELTYFDKQKRLLFDKYDFTYKITGLMNIEYNGTYDKGTVDGFKETEDDLLRYVIENGKVYTVLLGEKSEYDKLYEGLDATLFEFDDLFMKLNQTSSTISKSSDSKIYHYADLDGRDFLVTTNDESITKINIVDSGILYEFIFKY